MQLGLVKLSKMARLSVCFIALCLFVGLGFVSLDSAWSQGLEKSSSEGQVIREIRLEGNVRVIKESVFSDLRSEEGEALDSQNVTDDIKKLYESGYFQKVKALWRRPGTLIFQVEEKPAVRNIFIRGNDELSTSSLKNRLELEKIKFYNKREVKEKSLAIEEYYESQSYFGTKVEPEIEEVEDNSVDITFEVEEGEDRYIRDIVFLGNDAISSSELEDQIETSSYRWWLSWATGAGTAHDIKIENDRRRITQHYLSKGYVDVKVAEPELKDIEDGIELVFRVSEGEQYRIGNLSVSGDLIDGSEEKTLEGIKLVSGEIFNANYLREDIFTVSSKFTDTGYAFTNVDPATSGRPEQRLIDIQFNIDKGDLVRINEIKVTGNQKTRDYVVRRSLKISEQELFSSSKIERSQQLLQRLGFFDEVLITPEPTSNPSEVDLNIQIREGQTGSISAGAGFSSGDGFLVNGSISENNIFGTGNSLTLNLDTGTSRETYQLSFLNPRVYNTHWSVGVDGLSVTRNFRDFDRKQAGGSLTVGYPLWFLGPEYLEDIRFSLKYEYLNIDIDNLSEEAPQLIVDQQGKTTSSSLTPRLVRNTVNNPLDPSEGSRQAISMEVAGIGAKEEFWLFQFSNTFFYPLWETEVGPVVFSNRLRFGFGDTTGDDDQFPLFRRFFPGGISTVRGYEFRELGPQDEDGNEFGGDKQVVANFEVIFPLFSSAGLNGVVFYDAGEAFNDEESIELGELRQAVGWGFRWRSPIAPLRIEFGYPINREEGESAVVTHFSFGLPPQ